MKKFSTLVVLMLVALATSKLYAQDGSYKKFSLGIAAEGALPLSGLNNAYNFGAGATLRAAIGLNEQSAVTLTTGAIAFLPKSLGGPSLKAALDIPIKAGYRYMFGGNFYGIGEAGFTLAKVYYNAGGGTQSISSTEFTYAPGIGVLLGGFDASLRYEGYSGSSFLGLRLGFNF